MMNYGQEKQTTTLDDEGSTISKVITFFNGNPSKVIKQFRIRIKVGSAQQEMSEYIKFTDELRKKREAGVLVKEKDDPSTIPAFVIDFPRFDEDGTYFVIKSWSEKT